MIARIAAQALRTPGERPRKRFLRSLRPPTAAYWTAYGSSFTAVFEWALMRAGAVEGVKAGKEAAQQWLERVKRGTRSSEPVALIGPSAKHGVGSCKFRQELCSFCR